MNIYKAEVRPSENQHEKIMASCVWVLVKFETATLSRFLGQAHILSLDTLWHMIKASRGNETMSFRME
jgi:hypothetical protein